MRKQSKKRKIPTKELQYLGDRISEARNKSGLTQQELAVQCHRGMRHIQNIEGGFANPSYEVLSDLIHRLGVSANTLFFSNMEQVEEEVQHLLCKFAVCTADERQIILSTLDCLVEQFLSRRYASPTKEQE